MANPKCRNCGKVLRENTNFLSFNHHEHMATIEEALVARGHAGKADRVTRVKWQPECEEREITEYGRTNLVILSDRPTGRNIVWWIYLRNGTFGYRGQGLFCTLGCGYAWAVREVRRQEKGK